MWTLISKHRLRGQRIALYNLGIQVGSSDVTDREHALWDLARLHAHLPVQRLFEKRIGRKTIQTSTGRGLLIGATRVVPTKRTDLELLLLGFCLQLIADFGMRCDGGLRRKLRRQAFRTRRELLSRPVRDYYGASERVEGWVTLLDPIHYLLLTPESEDRSIQEAWQSEFDKLAESAIWEISGGLQSSGFREYCADFVVDHFEQVFRSSEQLQAVLRIIDPFPPERRSTEEILSVLRLLNKIILEFTSDEDRDRAKQLVIKVADGRNSGRIEAMVELITEEDDDDSWIDL